MTVWSCVLRKQNTSDHHTNLQLYERSRNKHKQKTTILEPFEVVKTSWFFIKLRTETKPHAGYNL